MVVTEHLLQNLSQSVCLFFCCFFRVQQSRSLDKSSLLSAFWFSQTFKFWASSSQRLWTTQLSTNHQTRIIYKVKARAEHIQSKSNSHPETKFLNLCGPPRQKEKPNQFLWECDVDKMLRFQTSAIIRETQLQVTGMNSLPGRRTKQYDMKAFLLWKAEG